MSAVTGQHAKGSHLRERTGLLQELKPVNMLCLSMGLGGAERIVADLCWAFRNLSQKGWPVRGNIFVLSLTRKQYGIVTDRSYSVDGSGGGVVIHILAKIAPERRLSAVAEAVATSGTDVLYTHMAPQEMLEQLWTLGIRTIPVMHNQSQRWNCDPASFRRSHVPGVVAVAEAIRREVVQKGCTVPVHTIMHELPRLRGPVFTEEQRVRFRAKHGIHTDTVLIGMVGKVKAQKRYDIAIKALRRLNEHTDAKLMIVGPWKSSPSPSLTEHTRLLRIVQRLGLEDRVTFIRGSRRVGKYLSIFDVFLNTSAFEGLSIATMEARAHGLPLVLSDSGGQRERSAVSDTIVPANSTPAVFSLALANALRSTPRSNRASSTRIGLVPRLWVWLANFGCDELSPSTHPAVLFITNNLAQGGAQRSLTNLLAAIRPPQSTFLCALSEPFVPAYLRALDRANIHSFCFPLNATLWDRVEGLLDHVAATRVGTVCFWNVDLKIKALIVKTMSGTGIRVVEVSPGPQMFRGVRQSQAFLGRMAYSARSYFERVDIFVAKYSHPAVPPVAESVLTKLVVIPNGVSFLSETPASRMVRSRDAEASHAIVSVGRIVPAKMVDRLLLVAARLREMDSRITISIVGRLLAPEAPGYYQTLKELSRDLHLDGTVFFVGEADDALNFLPQFRAFVMLSKMQGCPNASLEAMASGLPVVANPDGGTSEQVEDGVTGFLVDEDDIEQIAQRLKWLLDHPERAIQMGEMGRKKAAGEFSIEAMGQRYTELLWQGRTGH